MTGERGPGLPIRIWYYIGGIALAALLLARWWWSAWEAPWPTSPGLVLLFFALAVLAQHFPLTLGPKFKTNGSIAVYFAALLTCGPPLAMAIAGAAQIVGGLTLSLLRREKGSGKRMRGMASVWFNAAQIPLAVGLAGVVQYAIAPQDGPTGPTQFADAANFVALPLAAATQYLVNSGAVALMVALQQRRNPVKVWLHGRAAAARTAAALLLLGVGMAVMARDYPWSPLLLIPLVVVVQFSLRWAIDRRDDRQALHALARQREFEARTAPCAPTDNDRDLAAALMARNPHALAALFDRYGPEAYGLAVLALGDIATAQDAVSTVFLRVWQDAARTNGVPEAPRQWLLDLVGQEAAARRVQPTFGPRARAGVATITPAASPR